MDNAYVLQRELGDLFTFAPSGNSYIDAMQPGVSKRRASRCSWTITASSVMRSWPLETR